MKMHYLAAALLGAWYLTRRSRMRLYQNGEDYHGYVARPALNTPFQRTGGGVRKPEAATKTQAPAGA